TAPADPPQMGGEAADPARIGDHDRQIDVAVEPATVIGDRDRLRQAVDNLFANVRSYTPPGTKVAVGLHPVDGQVELSVSDTGPGLSEEQAAQAFERFYRVDSSRARASGGVGLGLSIGPPVAQAHRGEDAPRATP